MTNISRNHKHGVPAVTRGVALRARSKEKEEIATLPSVLRASLWGVLTFLLSGVVLLTATAALASYPANVTDDLILALYKAESGK